MNFLYCLPLSSYKIGCYRRIERQTGRTTEEKTDRQVAMFNVTSRGQTKQICSYLIYCHLVSKIF